MKILVISKPIYSYIFPLMDYPKDGDIFNIEKTVETLTNLGSITACTLGKYGLDVSFTGLVGEDIYKEKIIKILDTYRVEHKYLEVNYKENSLRNFQIYNQKTNKFTKINELCLKSNLTKYKYEFIPDILIMDDKDYNANLAALNNYPNSKTIFISEKFNSDSNIFCNKCKYVICNLSFASVATGILNNLNKSKTIVEIFQKYIDLYSSNLIIRLDNFDMLYCVNDEVRLLKNQNNNLSNKETVYYSVLSYFLIQNNVEEAIKNTNKAMLNSKNNINVLENIPDYNYVKQIVDENNEKNKTIMSNNFSENNIQDQIIKNQNNEMKQSDNIQISIQNKKEGINNE